MKDRKYKIIIAEDDPDILQLLELYLRSEDYEIVTAGDGAEAYKLIVKEKPDLGIFDIMMPEMNGYELLAKTREIMNIPVIFLSAKDSDQERILGLDLGADDYIPKPFNPLEVTARVRAALRRFYDFNPRRREAGGEQEILEEDGLRVNLSTLTVEKNGEEIPLTSTELKLLIMFMKHPGRVYTKKQLMEQVNENYVETDINSVRVHISNLRDKLGPASDGESYIKTVRGLGYKLESRDKNAE